MTLFEDSALEITSRSYATYVMCVHRRADTSHWWRWLLDDVWFWGFKEPRSPRANGEKT